MARSQGNLTVLTPPREVDSSNADQLRDTLTGAVRDHSIVVVDMSANTFCDSSGIRALVLGMQEAKVADCDLRIVMGGPSVRRIFRLTGVDQVLKIFESLDEATADVPPASA